MVRGVSLADWRARWKPVASTWVAARAEQRDGREVHEAQGDGDVGRGSMAVIEVIGCQAMTTEISAPTAMLTPTTVPAADKAFTGTVGSSAWAASTYQASSGPESSARKTP